MSPNLIVRKITGTKQKAELHALQLLCLPADVPIVCDAGGCSLGVYDRKRMIAFALARPSVGYQKTLYLSRVGVHPDYRGKGLQKELIQLREAWAIKHGFQHVITDTANHNTQSMRALISSGYKPFWPELVEPWGLRTSIYWTKPLIPGENHEDSHSRPRSARQRHARRDPA